MDFSLTQNPHKTHPLDTRYLDIIPGGLAWLAVILTLVGAIVAPAGVMIGTAALAAYMAVRCLLASIAHLWGLHLIRGWEARDWAAEYQRRAGPDALPLESVHHLVIIPNVHESPMVLRRSLDRLAAQHDARTAITVVLAMEGIEPGAHHKADALCADYQDAFARVLVTIHPPGDVACKSANLDWALGRATQIMVDELGCSLDQIVVTTMDADTLWHPRYFESLRVLFATDPHRHRIFWQAPIRYHGGVWQAHPLMRILHAYASAWELAYLAAPWWRALPISSYSVSLRLLHDAGYYDPDAIADEWHMFIKSTFALDAPPTVRPIYLPFLAGATGGDTWAGAIRARYHQTLRHAWGAKEIGYTLAQMRRCNRPAWGLLARVAHDNLLAGAGWIILFLGPQLPLLFHPAWVRDHLDSAPFLILQGALIVLSVLTVIFWSLDVRLRPPRPYDLHHRDRLTELFSLPLLAILTAVCVALPVLHAQTRLMLGRSILFRVTAKQ
jgi:hypothetical protein